LDDIVKKFRSDRFAYIIPGKIPLYAKFLPNKSFLSFDINSEDDSVYFSMI